MDKRGFSSVAIIIVVLILLVAAGIIIYVAISDSSQESVKNITENKGINEPNLSQKDKESKKSRFKKKEVACDEGFFETHVHVHPHEFGPLFEPSKLVKRMGENNVNCAVMFLEKSKIDSNFKQMQEPLSKTGTGITPFLSVEGLGIYSAEQMPKAFKQAYQNNPEKIEGFGEIAYYSGPLKGSSLKKSPSSDLFNIANREGLFVMIHPTEKQADELSEVASKYPNATLLLHGYELLRNTERGFLSKLLKNNDNIYWTFDLSLVFGPKTYELKSADEYRKWVENNPGILKGAKSQLNNLVEAAPNRVMWGTDMAVKANVKPEVYKEFMNVSRELVKSLPEKHRENYKYKNAQRLFGTATGFDKNQT